MQPISTAKAEPATTEPMADESGVRAPGALPLSSSSSISYAPPQFARLLQGRDYHENVTDHVLDRLFHSLVRGALEPGE
jgi:hypothetical protein